MITTIGIALGCVLTLSASHWLSREYGLPRLDLFYLAGGVALMWVLGQVAAWQHTAQGYGVPMAVTGSFAASGNDLSGGYAVCEQGGSAEVPHARTVVIGPEGGWAPGEIPESAIRLHLGDTVLRVETAAIVAASRMI